MTPGEIAQESTAGNIWFKVLGSHACAVLGESQVIGGEDTGAAEISGIKAQIGVLLSLQAPTRPMEVEAASAGFYTSPWNPIKPHPRLQILTIKDLLKGKRLDMPPPGQVNVTFQRAPRPVVERAGPGQGSLFDGEP